jgi:hypothetical protein
MNAGVSCAYTWEKEMKEAIKMRYFMFGLDEGERFPQMAYRGFQRYIFHSGIVPIGRKHYECKIIPA